MCIRDRYHGAVAGGADGKYYLSVLDAENQPQLLVYDVRQGLWHREDDLRAVGFAVSGGVLYAMTRAGDILALKGGGTVQMCIRDSTAAAAVEMAHTTVLRLPGRSSAESSSSYDSSGENPGSTFSTPLSSACLLYTSCRRIWRCTSGNGRHEKEEERWHPIILPSTTALTERR